MDAAEHRRRTRDAYERLAPVWSATTDDGPWNAHLERPALQAMIPRPLDGTRVLDAGCGSGAMAEWLLGEGAEVTGVDLSPAMVDAARRRCGDRGRFDVADLAGVLPYQAGSFDGIISSLTLHYLEDWTVPLASFATALGPRGWLVFSTDHPAGEPLEGQSGGYFATELVSDTWHKADVEVTQWFWRRPLGAIIDACRDAGFTLDRVHEARPSPEAIERFPDQLGPLVDRPSFIIFRFVRSDDGGDTMIDG